MTQRKPSDFSTWRLGDPIMVGPTTPYFVLSAVCIFLPKIPFTCHVLIGLLWDH